MERALGPSGFLFAPPLGTRVHDWLLVDHLGHGAYGAVYRAVRIGQESAEPVALKLALRPWDPRFMREVGLLSLVQHPHIPRLISHGFWRHASGASFPFITMECVQGTPLYTWARERHPTNLQVLRMLGQLARALEAAHAAGAVHRDVKGDNVLVRHLNGQAVLMDFGAGNYPCAARLTWEPLPPGTAPYRAPEAWLFERRSEHSQGAHYEARPADDVYALGVTAYRLVTGEYPFTAGLLQDEAGVWQVDELPLLSPQKINPRVDAQLSALVVRMLSVSPEARGSAGELAEALEATAEGVEKETGGARVGTQVPVPQAPPQPLPERSLAQVGERSWRVASACVLAGALVIWAWQAVHAPSPSVSVKEPATSSGPANLGEAASQHPPSEQTSSQPQTISQEPPPEPYPGQLTPDARGRCPGSKQIPFNGGCWVEVPAKDAEECEKNSLVFLKGRCYGPVMGSRRKPPPTSAPSDSR